MIPIKMAGINILMELTSGMLTSFQAAFFILLTIVICSAYAAYISGILINVVGFAGASMFVLKNQFDKY